MPIIEVLTAYVRLHALRQSKEDIAPEDVPKDKLDIQAILTVLGRRRYYYGKGNLNPSIYMLRI